MVRPNQFPSIRGFFAHVRTRRDAFRALADWLLAYRRRAHRSVQLALARQTGGKMLLRIEDTDRERSTDAAIGAIIDGMNGSASIGTATSSINSRAPAVTPRSPSNCWRRARPITATPARRNSTRCASWPASEGRPPRYDGRWRDLGGSPQETQAIAEGRKPVVRLKAPREGETIIEDKVQGRVVFPNKDLDDLVLLRSDGTPTYMLAVVVDDHDMGVTQIIRGDDHLTNAARQTQIYQALGWTPPSWPISR